MFKLKLTKDEAEVLEFDGKPFLIANSMLLQCHRGLQTSKKSAKMNQDNDYCAKRNKVLQHTKKINCPAEIALKEIVIFPEFAVNEESEWKKRSASKQLRLLLTENPQTVKIEKRIHICLPKYEDHKGHDCKTEEYIQRIDKRLLTKLKHLVGAGVTNTKDIAHYLEQFVTYNRHTFFRDGVLPSKLNRRFYPSHAVIRVHVNKWINELRGETMYEENIACLLDGNSSTTDDTLVDFTAIDNLSNNHHHLDAILSSSSSNTYFDGNLSVDNTTTIITSVVDSNAANNNLSNLQTAKHCREILKELTSATYLMNDLGTFHSKLLELKSYVDASIYKEDLPPVIENQKKRKSCDSSLIQKLPEY